MPNYSTRLGLGDERARRAGHARGVDLAARRRTQGRPCPVVGHSAGRTIAMKATSMHRIAVVGGIMLAALGLVSGWSVLARRRQERKADALRQVAREAAFIGNISTRIYHAATDPFLPREDHRVYFASAQEAEAIGYRAAGHRA